MVLAGVYASAATHLEGVVGVKIGVPPNAAASSYATARLLGTGWSVGASTSLANLPSRERCSSLVFSVEREGLTLETKATFAHPPSSCESLTVKLSGLTGLVALRSSAPRVTLGMSAGLGTVVIPSASPFGNLSATLTVGEHWLRVGPSPELNGSISLYRRPKDHDDGGDVRASANFLIELSPCRLSRISLGTRLALEDAVIMASVAHSASVPLSVASSVVAGVGPVSLSVSASFVFGSPTPLRISAKAELKWPAT